jgi:lysophospholipase L1-like esterase
VTYTFVRRAVFAIVLAGGAALTACGGNMSVPPPTGVTKPTPTPTPTIAPVAYTAIGASDAVGYGASIPCANPPVVSTPTCLNLTGTGYVPDIARGLVSAGHAVTLDDLGISGAVLGPDILKVGNMFGSVTGSHPCTPRTGSDVIPADFITNELPNVPANSTLITIFAGGNDTNAIVNAAVCLTLGGASTAQVTAFVNTEVAAFGIDLQTLLTELAAKTTNHAEIVVADLPNFANLPFATGGLPGLTPEPTAVRDLLAGVSVTGIDQGVYETAAQMGVPTVDLLCDPKAYLPANYYTDGFHPNDAGYALFAQKYLAVIAAKAPPLPSFTCSETSVSARRADAAPPRPLPNFEPR